MATLFLSHSSKDNTLVDGLRTWLSANGHESVFIDFDPDTGIRGGADWEQEVYRMLRGSQAVIAFITSNWIASKWCFAEIVIAREKGKKIIPLLMDGTSLPSVLADTHYIDVTQNSPTAYSRLAASLRDFFNWDGSRIPYPGLSSFQEADAGVYFGRKEEIFEFNQQLESRRRQGNGARGLFLILGASGSGKSSLVRAGMVPRLRQDDHWLIVDAFRPGADPFLALTRALSMAYGPAGSGTLDEIRKDLTIDGEGLSRMGLQLLAKHPNAEATILLVIDQAEELFTTEVGATSRTFIDMLGNTLKLAKCPVMILATLRSSSLERFQGGSAIGFSTLVLHPLSEAQLPLIIEKPAEQAGIQLETGLVTTMIADAPRSDTMPLLAFTLNQLWFRAHTKGAITLADYHALGGVEGSVRRAAENAIGNANLTEQDLSRLRALFIPNMVRYSSDGTYSKRTACMADLGPDADRLLDPFIRERLLVADIDSLGKKTVEITHEALLRTWPLLAGWIAEDRDQLRLLETLRNATGEWLASDRNSELLVHRDGRLKELQRLVADARFALAPGSDGSLYLEACIEAQQAREAASRNSRRRVLWGLSIALIITVALGTWALIRRVAVQRSADALQNTLGLNALALSREDRTLPDALNAAINASDPTAEFPIDHLQAQEGLTATVSRLVGEEFIDGPGVGYDFVFMDSGRKLVTSGYDRRISIWDLTKRKKDTTLSLDRPGSIVEGIPLDIASNDSILLATSSFLSEMRIWQLRGNSAIEPIYPSDMLGISQIWAGLPPQHCLSPEGHYLAATLPYPESSDTLAPGLRPLSDPGAKSLAVRNLRTGQTDIIRNSHIVSGLAFSHSQQWLAIGNAAGELSIWSVREKRVLSTASCSPERNRRYFANEIDQLRFSNHDDTLFSAGRDGILRIWDLRDSSHLLRAPGVIRVDSRTPAPAYGASFRFQLSPEGDRLLTQLNGQVELWSLPSYKAIATVALAKTPMMSYEMAFSPDGRFVLTLGSDNIRLWEGRQGYFIRQIDVPNGNLHRMAFVPNSTGIRFITQGQRLTLWTLYGTEFARQGMPVLPANPQEVIVASGMDGNNFIPMGIAEAKLSPDKRCLVYMDDQRNVKVRTAGQEVVAARVRNHTVNFSFGGSGHYLLIGDRRGPRQLEYQIFGLPDCQRIFAGSIIDLGSQAVVSPNGRYIAMDLRGYKGSRVRIAESSTGRLINQSKVRAAEMIYLDYIDSNLVAAAFADASVLLFHPDNRQAETQEESILLKGSPFAALTTALYCRPKDLLIGGCVDSTLRIWQCSTGQLLKTIRPAGPINDLHLSTDASKLVTAAGEKVQVWDLANFRELSRFIVHNEKPVKMADFFGEDELISLGDKNLCIYPLSNKRWYQKAIELRNDFK